MNSFEYKVVSEVDFTNYWIGLLYRNKMIKSCIIYINVNINYEYINLIMCFKFYMYIHVYTCVLCVVQYVFLV